MIEYGPIKMNRKEKKYLSQARMSTSLGSVSFYFYDYLTRPNHPAPETRGFYYEDGGTEEFTITHHKELTNW